MLVVHAGPRLLNSSLSLDVRQLSSRSWASGVGSGAITRDARPPDDPPGSTSVRHASTTSDKGSKRKCTSSGALGSRMFPFSRACNQRLHQHNKLWSHTEATLYLCLSVDLQQTSFYVSFILQPSISGVNLARHFGGRNQQWRHKPSASKTISSVFHLHNTSAYKWHLKCHL